MKTIWVIAVDEQEPVGFEDRDRQIIMLIEGDDMEGTPLAFASEELALNYLNKYPMAKLLEYKPLELNLVETLE